MNSVADVWQVVLERLRAGGLAETAISTWFDEVEAVAIRDMTFYLCCPNDFKRGTIESLFLPNLKAALKEIFSADFDVKLLSAAERSALGQEKPKKPTSLLESGEFTFDTFVVGDSNKLAYAAGFTSAQVVASQAWFGCLFFALATLAGHALGHRWQRVGWKLALKLMGLGALTCLTSILYCYAMSVLPAPVALTLLFQFTWLGLVWQTVMTRRPPRLLQVASALVIVFGTVFASGVYKTGITGYDPVALLCALGAAVSCSLFVTLSGKVEAPCSSEQRGVIVCAGSVVMSLTVCPDYVVSGVLAQGILPFAVIAGFFGMLCPVLLFGMGSPHLPAGLSTVMAAAELPAGLLIAMIVLGEPLGVVEWLGVAIILAGVCLAQVPSLLGGREARRAAAGQAVS